MKFTFQGLTETIESDISVCQQDNKAYADAQAKLNALVDALNIKSILANNNPSERKALMTEARTKLSEIISNNKELIEDATPSQLMKIFITFRSLNDFKGMLDFYQSVNNEEFKNAPMVQEFFLVALNKQKQPDPQKTISIAHELIAQGKATGEVYGALGKANLLLCKWHKKRADVLRAAAQSAPNNSSRQNNLLAQSKLHQISYLKYLRASKDAYLSGFEKFAEYYPGINAAYRFIDLGEIDTAKKIAQLVILACQKEGARDSSPNDQDYWRSSTMLEALCIINVPKEQLTSALRGILRLKGLESWQLESTYEVLQARNKLIPCDNIEYVLEVLDQKRQDDSYTLATDAGISQASVSKTEALQNKSYSYRGITSSFEGSSSIPGNFRYGGQLPDHTVSRKDIQLFDRVLETPFELMFPSDALPKELDGKKSFADITNTDDFLKACDLFIRYHYGNSNFAQTGLNLEQNAEINNSLYDQTVEAVRIISGKQGQRLVDSRTNISSIFALGMGDCRHHAQVKQILFDRWQSRQMQADIVGALKAMSNNDEKSYAERVAHFNETLNVQLRTIDVCVELPIKIRGLYDAQKTEDGKFIRADHPSTLEEHTMTVLMKTNDEGELLEARLADAFYQEAYQWGNHNIPVEDIEIVGDNFAFGGGSLPGEKSSDGKPIEIKIKPTVYAGARDNTNIDDCGEALHLLGIPVGINDDTFFRCLKNRPAMEGFLNRARENAEQLHYIVEKSPNDSARDTDTD